MSASATAAAKFRNCESDTSEDVRKFLVAEEIAHTVGCTCPILQDRGGDSLGDSVLEIALEDSGVLGDDGVGALPNSRSDVPCQRIAHILNAGVVNARADIDPEVVVARARVDIEEAAPVVNNPVCERKLHHSLLKLDVRIIVKRPGSIAARRELGEKSIAEDAPLPFPHFALGHDSPIKMLDHGQGVIVNVSVKPLHPDGAVHAQRPQVVQG